jgi:hypothetical protein
MDAVTVRVDFDGASLDVQRIEGARVFARLREESICRADGAAYDYNRHFAFGIENRGPAGVEAEILIQCASADELPDAPALLFGSRSPTTEFTRAEVWSRSDARKAYAIRVALASGETRYFANYLFRPHSFLLAHFDSLGRAGDARRHVIGHSVQGRELVAYSYLRPSSAVPRPAMLITSGVHPPEPDTLATEAIMEHLAAPASADLRDAFDVHLVPVMNPDGFVLGYNGCNAHQINFYWLFDRNDHGRCPEAQALWAYAAKMSPVVYFDWHGYTFQRGKKHAAPYLKPVLLHEGRGVRRLVRAMNARVAQVAGGHTTTGFLTYAPSTLATQLTLAFNTITYAKFHLELRLGIARNKELAVQAVEAVFEIMRENRALNPRTILKRPHGGVGGDPVAAALRPLLFWWGGHARPALGRLRRRLTGAAPLVESPA